MNSKLNLAEISIPTKLNFMSSFPIDSVTDCHCDGKIPKNKKETNENSCVKPRKLVFDDVKRKRRKISSWNSNFKKEEEITF